MPRGDVSSKQGRSIHYFPVLQGGQIDAGLLLLLLRCPREQELVSFGKELRFVELPTFQLGDIESRGKFLVGSDEEEAADGGSITATRTAPSDLKS